ncbi:MAG: O-antigen ligase family protein [Pseudomonadales bacterium]|nr:O-antigen ligase family protein [Pseudomonadales bacterium]
MLATLCILNLNGVVKMIFGFERTVSILILFSSLGCIASAPTTLHRVIGRSGVFFVLFLALYLSVATIMSNTTKDINSLFFQYFATFLVVLAAAASGWLLAQYKDIETHLKRLFWLWFIATSSIFFTPIIRAIAVNARNPDSARMSGFFNNPNEAGMVAVITFALALALFHGKGRSFYFGMATLISAIATIATFSKTAILSLIALTCLFIFRFIIQNGFSIRGALLVGVLLLPGGWLFSVGLDSGIFKHQQEKRLAAVQAIIWNQEITADHDSERTVLIREGLKKIAENPVFGQGLGELHLMEGPGLGVHNTYLMILGESGLFPIFIMLIFILNWVWSSIWCREAVIRVIASNYILVFLLHCMSSHTVLNRRFHNIMIGLTFGLLAGRWFYYRRKLLPVLGHTNRANHEKRLGFRE